MLRIATVLLVLSVTAAWCRPADWWSDRWRVRAEVPAEAVGPTIELEANFTVLLGGASEFAPESLRLIVRSPDGPAPAPLRFDPLPGYDARSSAVGRVTAVLSQRVPGTPMHLYFDTADAGPWDPGPSFTGDPPASERLIDGGLEGTGEDGSPWLSTGPSFPPSDDARSGQRSVLLVNESADDVRGVFQQVDLERSRAFGLVISGWSRCEDVSGQPDSHYSLWADLQYTDGSFLYGQAVPFDTGSHDWQFRELTIRPTKPVRWIKLRGLFRHHAGRAWFDDLSVREVERYALYAAERSPPRPVWGSSATQAAVRSPASSCVTLTGRTRWPRHIRACACATPPPVASCFLWEAASRRRARACARPVRCLRSAWRPRSSTSPTAAPSRSPVRCATPRARTVAWT